MLKRQLVCLSFHYAGDTLENTKLVSVFFPSWMLFLTEGNEKEGLADGRGFHEQKHGTGGGSRENCSGWVAGKAARN